MSDEKNIETIHGYEINMNDHEHARTYLKHHIGKEQLREMIRNAKNSNEHSSHFTANFNDKNIKYKIVANGDKLEIHEAHHG